MTSGVAMIGFSAALLMGLAGSVHCFGMCGGIAGALGMRVRSLGGDAARVRLHAALYQAGRIAGYVFFGALSGALGQVLQSLLDLAHAAMVLRIGSGILLLLIAIRMLVRWNGLAVLERAGMRIWKLIQPFTRVSGIGPTQTLMLGFLWGFLPCGMVYSMLAFAAMSGSALTGAELMLVFGLGTAPAMFGSTLIAAKSVRMFSSTWAKRATGILLATFGVWMMTAPFYFHVHSALLTSVNDVWSR